MSDEHYEIRQAGYEAVARGDAVIVGEEDGEAIFAITEIGRERAREVIDAAIRGFGEDAPEALAQALGVPLSVGEKLVEMRQTQKEEEQWHQSHPEK